MGEKVDSAAPKKKRAPQTCVAVCKKPVRIVTTPNAGICEHYSGGTPDAFVVSKQISAAWVNFARTGNPNHDGLPQWPKYTAEQRATMYFDTRCEVLNDPKGEGLSLIASS
jgi:para-nitrobenzyl esterase